MCYFCGSVYDTLVEHEKAKKIYICVFQVSALKKLSTVGDMWDLWKLCQFMPLASIYLLYLLYLVGFVMLQLSYVSSLPTTPVKWSAHVHWGLVKYASAV